MRIGRKLTASDVFRGAERWARALPLARVLLAVLAVLGLAVLARTALYYWHADAFALSLVVCMAAAFGAGIVELWSRNVRTTALEAELSLLSASEAPATEATIDSASAELRPLLRARVSSGAISWSGATFTPYLVGLLVMLGLLGTFLGLFETLRGAREALSGATDPEALRSSLNAPMLGLTRSFGTSAAGVSASAILGLALVFGRRGEASFVRAFQAYAAGPLRSLTVAERHITLLDSVAKGTATFPEAAVTLERVARGLLDLDTSWREAVSRVESRATESEERRKAEHVAFFDRQAKLADAMHERWLALTNDAIQRASSFERSLAEGNREQIETLTRAILKQSEVVTLAFVQKSDELAKVSTQNAETLAASIVAQAETLSSEVRRQSVELADATRRRLAPFRAAQLGGTDRLAASHAEHGMIVAAILAGDAAAAAAAVRAHLAATEWSWGVLAGRPPARPG